MKAGGNLKLWDSDLLLGGPRPPLGPPRAVRQGALQAHHGQAAPARSASAQRAPDRRLATLVRRSQRAIVSPLAYRSTMTLRSPSPSTLLRPNLVPLALARYDRCAIPPLMRCDGVAGP